MTSYVVIKIYDERKLSRKKLVIDGYSMNPRLKSKDDFIEVNNIIIVNNEMIQCTIQNQFHHAYRKLFKKVMDILGSDSTEGDAMLALDEVAKMKKILEEKYKEQTKKKDYKIMVQKTNLLDQKLKEKIIIHQNLKKMLESMVYEEEREKGRGR